MPAARITIEIDLGNDAMRTGDDVAAALVKVSDVLTGTGDMQSRESGIIRDDNGNTCGTWSVQ